MELVSQSAVELYFHTKSSARLYALSAGFLIAGLIVVLVFGWTAHLKCAYGYPPPQNKPSSKDVHTRMHMPSHAHAPDSCRDEMAFSRAFIHLWCLSFSITQGKSTWGTEKAGVYCQRPIFGCTAGGWLQ